MQMSSYRTDPQRGFAMLDVVACIALLAIGIGVALGAVAAVAKGNATAIRRDLALMTARNILARARAVAALAPDADPQHLSDRTTWALRASSTFATSAALPQAGAPNATLPLNVQTTFANGRGTDYSGTLTITVSYPLGADQNARTQTISLSERIAPSGFTAGTVIVQPAAEPRRLAN